MLCIFRLFQDNQCTNYLYWDTLTARVYSICLCVLDCSMIVIVTLSFRILWQMGWDKCVFVLNCSSPKVINSLTTCLLPSLLSKNIISQYYFDSLAWSVWFIQGAHNYRKREGRGVWNVHKSNCYVFFFMVSVVSHDYF